MPKNKLVSVIIPSYNEEKLIEKTLLSLKRQSYQPIEIIVVYRGSDRTAEIAKKYTDRVFLLEERGASRARNFGAKKAQGKYLVFLDADSKLSGNTIQNVVHSLEKERFAGGTAKIVYETKNYKIKAVEALQNLCLSRWGICLCQFIYTTRDVFEKSKGWPESIDFGEDMNFLKRLSAFGKLKYDQGSEVLTSPRRFIRNKDYFYAILGGFLVLGGIKNLPFYPIRDAEEIQRKEPKIKSLFNKKIALSPQAQLFLIKIMAKERFKKLFENYKKVLKTQQRYLKSVRLPLIIWTATKAIFLPLWFLAGAWVWQRTGIWGTLPFVLIIGFYQLTDFWNQFLISRTVKSLKETLKEKTANEEKSFLFEKIWQLEVKRSPFTAIFYLFKRTGLKKTPQYSPQKELADIGPCWIGKEVGLILSLLYSIFYYLFYHARYLNQIKIRGKTVGDLSVWKPLRLPIAKSFQEKGVFLGADIGCGEGKIINLLAVYCKREQLPAVFFGIDSQSDIIEIALRKFKRNGFSAVMHQKGKIPVDKLADLAKKERGPVLCLINANFENISQLFEPKSLDLVFLINTKHHLEEAWNKGGRKAIEDISEHWLVLEERRSWLSLFFAYLVGWFVSRLIVCEAEDSILSMYTPKEWTDQKIKTITTFPFLIWAMSDSLYDLLKK